MARLESQNSNTQTVANSKVLGYLGRGLSLEFASSQHYLAQAALAKSRQEISYADEFIVLANEEFQHVNLIVDYMVNRGVLPAQSTLHPAIATANIADSLNNCMMLENSLAQLYLDAIQHCLSNSLHQDHSLFNQLLKNKSDQLIKLQNWLANHIKTQ